MTLHFSKNPPPKTEQKYFYPLSQMEQTTECDSFARCCYVDLVISPGSCRNTGLYFSAHTQTGNLVNCGETVTEFDKDYLGLEQLTAPLSRKT